MMELCEQGVIGEGYERLMNPKSVPEEDDYKFHGRQPTALPVWTALMLMQRQPAPHLRAGR